MSRARWPSAAVLLWLAAVNVGVHLLGLAFMAVGIRRGSPMVPLAERMLYLAQRPWGWTLGWGTWMLCAGALVAFFAAAASTLDDTRASWAGRLAVSLVCAGAAVDLLCDVVYIAVLPAVAAHGAAASVLFEALERLAHAGGLVVANGLYSAGVLVLTLALGAAAPQARAAFGLGAAVSGFGMVMVIAGLAASTSLAALATLPTIGLYCVWVLAVARALERPGAGAAS